jgi:DNA helicase HerA-like ATPase
MFSVYRTGGGGALFRSLAMPVYPPTMPPVEPLLIAQGAAGPLLLQPSMANRHGLIAGATGTGKTVTLQRLAEGFSRIGVPVFLADVKGDLSGLCRPGGGHPKIAERVKLLGLTGFTPRAAPVRFWDVFGTNGHPLRTTVSEMGPLLLARVFELNDTQAGVLSLAFRVADDQGLLLLDVKDLRAMLQHVADRAREIRSEYGNVSPASIGAIQRALLQLEEQGGALLFGEPALELRDLVQTDWNGAGIVNILTADRLLQSPRTYATLLLWLLSELYEQLPEVGDLEKPRLVFFFDEAHLLFDDAPKVLLDRIEQVVRLVRSKGVGVYFVTQNPLDIPDAVLGQLGNRVQHALRAFTPRDQKVVRAAAETFRAGDFDVAAAITELAVGEALVSLLDAKGVPGAVQRAWIVPPESQVGAITPEERQQVIRSSDIKGRYEASTDRESAYERLKARVEAAPVTPAPEPAQAPAPVRRGRETVGEAMMKSAARAAASHVGRSLVRGILGSLLGGRR